MQAAALAWLFCVKIKPGCVRQTGIELLAHQREISDPLDVGLPFVSRAALRQRPVGFPALRQNVLDLQLRPVKRHQRFGLPVPALMWALRVDRFSPPLELAERSLCVLSKVSADSFIRPLPALSYRSCPNFEGFPRRCSERQKVHSWHSLRTKTCGHIKGSNTVVSVSAPCPT